MQNNLSTNDFNKNTWDGYRSLTNEVFDGDIYLIHIDKVFL